MSYQDLLGPLPESPIGRDFDHSRAADSFIPTARAVAFQPTAFFSALPRRGNYASPIVFAVICSLISAVIGGIIALIGGGGVGGFISGLIGAVIGVVIGLFIVAVIAHLLVTIFIGSSNAGFEATFRVVAYSTVTRLLGWIPVVGGLISLYSIYLAIVGIREVHQTTTGKAAMVVLIPVVVFGVIAFVAGAALLAILALGPT
jgi:hypothetical protein